MPPPGVHKCRLDSKIESCVIYCYCALSVPFAECKE